MSEFSDYTLNHVRHSHPFSKKPAEEGGEEVDAEDSLLPVYTVSADHSFTDARFSGKSCASHLPIYSYLSVVNIEDIRSLLSSC